jgi:hypothetical protein
MAIPATPGAGPFVMPPWAIPGTPENKAWTDNAYGALRGLTNLILEMSRKKKASDTDACEKRYEEELQRCYADKWQVAHPHYTAGCKERARERWIACIRNGGKPSPDEPPEWKSGPDADEDTWINPNR